MGDRIREVFQFMEMLYIAQRQRELLNFVIHLLSAFLAAIVFLSVTNLFGLPNGKFPWFIIVILVLIILLIEGSALFMWYTAEDDIVAYIRLRLALQEQSRPDSGGWEDRLEWEARLARYRMPKLPIWYRLFFRKLERQLYERRHFGLPR
jgi:hypothetical protein